jgi:hypothetical protein
MVLFEAALDRASQLDGNEKIIAIQALGRGFARDIAIVADKLRTKTDPLSGEFRSAPAQVRQLVRQNIDATSGIIDGGRISPLPAFRSPPHSGAIRIRVLASARPFSRRTTT